MEENQNFVQRVVGWPARFKSYVQDLQMEMHRVTWPTWKQVRATTGVVIAAVFAFAAYFWAVDMVLTKAMDRVFAAFK